jgi:hypothetical protein
MGGPLNVRPFFFWARVLRLKQSRSSCRPSPTSNHYWSSPPSNFDHPSPVLAGHERTLIAPSIASSPRPPLHSLLSCPREYAFGLSRSLCWKTPPSYADPLLIRDQSREPPSPPRLPKAPTTGTKCQALRKPPALVPGKSQSHSSSPRRFDRMSTRARPRSALRHEPLENASS